MKPGRIPQSARFAWRLINLTHLAGVALLSFTASVFAQVAEHDVDVLAKKTVRAIQLHNTRFFSDIVDPQGIEMGFDEPTITAAHFRNELRMKDGAYCVIFDDPDCSHEGNARSSSISSLQHLIGDGVVIKTVQQGQTNGVEVVSSTVSNRGNPNETYFTLWFRRMGRRWVLAHIDYE
jgi:hypothetical protein